MSIPRCSMSGELWSDPEGNLVHYYDHEAEIKRWREENDRFREAGFKLVAALSRIDYLLGKPNEMQVSDYDLHCDEDLVVMRAEKAHERSEFTPDEIEALWFLVKSHIRFPTSWEDNEKTLTPETVELLGPHKRFIPNLLTAWFKLDNHDDGTEP